jgi:hypothetical protein
MWSHGYTAPASGWAVLQPSVQTMRTLILERSWANRSPRSFIDQTRIGAGWRNLRDSR